MKFWRSGAEWPESAWRSEAIAANGPAPTFPPTCCGMPRRGFPKYGNMCLVHLREVGLAEFRDDSFDVVYSTNVFPHLDELDRWRYVQEAFRVLGPGGRIFIDNVDLESEAGWTIFANDGMRFANLQRPPYMPRYSTAAELMSYAMRAGFQEVAAHRRSPLVVVTGTKDH